MSAREGFLTNRLSESAALAEMAAWASGKYYSKIAGAVLGYNDAILGNSFSSGAISLGGAMPTIVTGGLGGLSGTMNSIESAVLGREPKTTSETLKEAAQDAGAGAGIAAINTAVFYVLGYAVGKAQNGTTRLMENETIRSTIDKIVNSF